MAAGLEWEGMDTLIAVMHNLKPNVHNAVANLMVEVSYDVFAESQLQVPVRYGVLKASGHVDPPSITESDVTINIGYGGAAAAYAYFVHENLGAYHIPPTKAKFLEDPMKNALKYLQARVYKNSIEAAIMGNMPGSPAKRQQAEVTRDIKASGRRSRSARGMTPEQVEKRLAEMARGRS